MFDVGAEEHAGGIAVELGRIDTRQIGKKYQPRIDFPLAALQIYGRERHAGHEFALEPFKADAAGFTDREIDIAVVDRAAINGNTRRSGKGAIDKSGDGGHGSGGLTDNARGNIAGADHASEVIQRPCIDHAS